MQSPQQKEPAMLNLDPRLYVDPAILPRERDSIFARTWQLLGPADQVAELIVALGGVVPKVGA